MNEENSQEAVVKVRIDQTEIDEMMWKFERIRDLMKEANLLACKLALEEKNIKVNFDCDG